MKTIYKLVRDKIPDIICEEGKKCDVTFLDKENFDRVIRCKLIEEATEVQEAKSKDELIEELADVQEVMDAIIRHYDLNRWIINQKQLEKRAEKGAFDSKLFLLATYEKDEK